MGRSEVVQTVVIGEIRSIATPAVATLIAPNLAVTGYQAVHDRTSVEITWPDGVTHADVLPDVKRGFAALRLDRAVASVEPELLASLAPSKGIAWISPGLLSAGVDAQAGTCGELVRVHGRQLLQLTVYAGTRRIAVGSPLIVEEKVAAIVTVVEHANVYATTVAAMAASTSAVEVANALPLDAADLFSRLSSDALRALSLAATLSYDSHRRVHMEHVLLALYADPGGYTRQFVDASPLAGLEGLQKALREAAERDIPELPPTSPLPLTAMPELSGHLRAALREARNASRLHRSGRVRNRDLLYGALSVSSCSMVKALIAAGLDKDRIDLGGPVLSRRSGIAGYRSDAVGGPDLLGIKRDVESLCMVLAAKEVEPPLSLGLFGEWGSGKSFFMRAMADWFDELARMPDNARPESPYCRRIVQLTFNAWHYSDTNLWATLTTAILQGLAEGLVDKDRPDSDYYQRASLETEKARKSAELATAEREAARLRADLQRADERIELGHAAGEALRAAAESPELREQVRAASEKAGITAAVGATATLQRQLLEARDLWDALVVMSRGRRRTEMVVLAIASVLVVIGGVAVLPWAVDHGLTTFLGTTTSVLVAVGVALGRLLAPAHRALSLVEQVRSRAEAAREQERRAIRLKADQAEKDAAAARTAIQGIDKKLENLRPDRRMRDFILQRSVSTDYVTQLGTISHARRDFEQLTRLLANVNARTSEELAGEDNLLPRIDRIILYIDDLDRCPEEKVVQVLQAVHMLLAFKLFIVVVGVDPRWLLHSLKQHSTAFRDDRSLSEASLRDTPPDSVRRDKEDERSHWRSTPLNYLEKIFQIPFTLRPMGVAGFNRLIDDLTKRDDSAEPDRPPSGADIETPSPASPTPQIEARTAGVIDRPVDPIAASSHVEPGQSRMSSHGNATSLGHGIRVAMDPGLLRFESFERECMKQLRDLIPSPRAAKRFVNVYRLLRNRLAEEDWSDLLDDSERGPYRPVLVLLAMLMSHPEETSEVLRTMAEGHLPGETGDVERGFWGVIDELVSRNTDSSQVAPDVAARWQELDNKLKEVRSLVPNDCGALDLRPYAATVARYSFHSGRLLLDVDAYEA